MNYLLFKPIRSIATRQVVFSQDAALRTYFGFDTSQTFSCQNGAVWKMSPCSTSDTSYKLRSPLTAIPQRTPKQITLVSSNNDRHNSNLISTTSNDRQHHHYHHKRGEEDGYHEKPPLSNISTSGAFLCFLGVIKSFFQSEEEKQKEMDGQKWEKMTPAEKLIAKGVMSMINLNFVKANQIFHKALHISQEEGDKDQEFILLNLMASCYFENEELEEAEKLFIDLIKRLLADDTDPHSPPILELSLKLAAIYSRSQNTHKKAVTGFNYVIESLTNRLSESLARLNELKPEELDSEKKNELALLGWTYDWYAKHLLTVHNIKEAVKYQRKALKISSLVLGPYNDQTLILMNDLGTTLTMGDWADEGLVHIQKAVDIAIKSESKELASFYLNLGLANLKMKNRDEGKKNCENAMRLALNNSDQIINSKEILNLSKKCISESEESDHV